MDTAYSSLVQARVVPFKVNLPSCTKILAGHFNKHLSGRISTGSFPHHRSLQNIAYPLKCTSSGGFSHGNRNPFLHQFSLSATGRRYHLLQPVKCSYSETTASESKPSVLDDLKNLSFESVKATLSRLTPVDICKLSLALYIAIAATKWTANVLLSPFFWMYFSWTWLFWPWILAVGVGIYGIYCFCKYLSGKANEFEQLAIVTSAFTWLTLVPPAHFNGFLEGWPYVFFFVYHYFFFFNVSIRSRLYGDLNPREHDEKWDVSSPTWSRILFSAGVMVGHWLAAFEGPELHLIPGGWSNVGVWALILITLFMQYHSTWYLAKYSEKVVVPTAVVQFGPYRWVRHPIYSSTMLLFLTYFLALRAPVSSLFIIAICLIYYGQKAKVEEALMTESFGDSYVEYVNRVRYKFIPFVY